MALTRINNNSLSNVTSAGLPEGSVIQVKSITYSTETNNTTQDYEDTGLSLSITPTSSSNKILVLVHMMTASLGGRGRWKLLRDTTDLEEQYVGDNSNADGIYGEISITYLDSPATTSSVTYKTQQRRNGATTVGVNNPVPGCTMTLMEIAGP